MDLLKTLLNLDRHIRATSIPIFQDKPFNGNGLTERLIFLVDVVNFRALALIIGEFLPYVFLFVLLLQFAYYFNRSTSNEIYDLLAKHSLFFFTVCFVYFVTINVGILYEAGINMFRNNYFLSGHYVINYKTQLVKLLVFML
jgi:hypothetical protein